MYKSDFILEDLPSRFVGSRASASYIYYLLKKGDVSKLHTLNNDEIWFWLSGGSLKMTLSNTSMQENADELVLGPDFLSEQISVIVPAQIWQTTEVIKGDYCLVACVVTPGYEDSDFIMEGLTNDVKE